MRHHLALLCLALAFLVPFNGIPQAQDTPNPDDWLLNAPGDKERWELIQKQLRGFSASMNEVGRRYQSLYDAIAGKNFELAAYQMQKIKEVIDAGTTRRPKRKANAQAIWVEKVFEPSLAAVKSGDAAKAWAAFTAVRNACMSCHEAEKVGFMNNQPLFRNTETLKE